MLVPQVGSPAEPYVPNGVPDFGIIEFFWISKTKYSTGIPIGVSTYFFNSIYDIIQHAAAGEI